MQKVKPDKKSTQKNFNYFNNQFFISGVGVTTVSLILIAFITGIIIGYYMQPLNISNNAIAKDMTHNDNQNNTIHYDVSDNISNRFLYTQTPTSSMEYNIKTKIYDFSNMDNISSKKEVIFLKNSLYNTLDTFAKLTKMKQNIQQLHETNTQLQKQIQVLQEKLENERRIRALLEKGLNADMHKALDNSSKVLIMDAIVTGYAPSAGGINCHGNCNNTARGFRVSAITGTNTGVTYCAVDPKVIPFYSIIIIQGYDKPCIAVDTGGAIKGNKIDLLFENKEDALKWGVKKRKIIVITPDR